MDLHLYNIVTIVMIGSMLFINITTWYLYGYISKLISEKRNQHLIEEQNKYYENQLDLMKDALKNSKIIQHDLKNMLSPIYTLALNGENKKVIERLAELTNFCTIGKVYASCGNDAIDSIINFKLQQVKKDDTQVFCEILMPSELEISPFDIAVILGNLIDNAITGIKTVEADRWICIKIRYTKERLIITISNSFDGVVLENKGVIITRKKDKQNHGLGLNSVERTIQKYNGAMSTHYKDCKFKAKVLLYV